ncbi:MAG: hypothetical protein SV253_06260 [Halobacteria archaeon]|nr:hypothetical protein [Halobacteria archaeon]
MERAKQKIGALVIVALIIGGIGTQIWAGTDKNVVNAGFSEGEKRTIPANESGSSSASGSESGIGADTDVPAGSVVSSASGGSGGASPTG